MNTVILRPMALDVDGVVEYYIKNSSLTVRYNVNSNESKEILRFVALSSRKPANMPLKLDVPVFDGGSASGKKTLSLSDAAHSGYNLGDIDTFALIFEEKTNTKIASAGFASLHWNISYYASRSLGRENTNPTKKAEKLLSRIKKKPVSDEEYDNVLRYVKYAFSKYNQSELIPNSEYKWYNFDCWENPIQLSSVKHLIYTEEFTKAYQDSGICLIGTNGIDRIAIAMKTDDKNPFVTADDCSTKENGFWLTGILLKKDGQYFERIE